LTLLTLHNAVPVGAYEQLVHVMIQAVFPDMTALEVRRQLDYLAHRKLVNVHKEMGDHWLISLTRHGINMVEYSVACDPGIARPVEYWKRSMTSMCAAEIEFNATN
jgi:hypothetical protein